MGSSHDQVMLGFKEHFENLATLQEETDFCDDYKLTSELKEDLIFDLYNSTKHSISVEPLNLDKTKQIIRSCKNGKAQDGEGISEEHFKSSATSHTDVSVKYAFREKRL